MRHDDALNYYNLIGEMTSAQLSELWQEETEEQYNEMLEVLFPIRWKDNAFLVGECLTHSDAGALYDAHIKIDGRFFWRPAPIHEFDPMRYSREVCAKFANND